MLTAFALAASARPTCVALLGCGRLVCVLVVSTKILGQHRAVGRLGVAGGILAALRLIHDTRVENGQRFSEGQLSFPLVIQRALQEVDTLMIEIDVAEALEVHKDVHLASERHLGDISLRRNEFILILIIQII